jgi:hypothetical protein
MADKAVDARQASLEEDLNRFLAEGAGLEDLEEYLEKRGLYDEQTGPAERLFVDEDEAAPESDRAYFNIRDRAAQTGSTPQALAEWVLRKRREKWKAFVEAKKVYDQQKDQLDKWLAKFQVEFLRFDGFAHFVLNEYTQDFHAGEARVDLIEAPLRHRKNSDVEEFDEAGAMAWAAKRKDRAKLAPRVLSRSAVKAVLTYKDGKWVDEDGVVVPFLRKVPPATPTKFEILQDGVGKEVK